MNFKRLWPYEEMTLETNLPKETVLKRLQDETIPWKAVRLDGNFRHEERPQYQGEIGDTDFKVFKLSPTRDSFNPMIEGSVGKQDGMTTVKMKLNVGFYTLVPWCIWMGIVGALCILALGARLSHKVGNQPVLLVPFGAFLFGYVLAMGSLRYARAKIKESLSALFEAREIG